MLLPPTLFAAIEPHFNHHDCWHMARRQGQEPLRAKFQGECGPHLHGIDEVGSGCDFLGFHRRMMRHFGWLLDALKPDAFRFEPWPGPMLPAWVQKAVAVAYPAFDFDAFYQRVRELVHAGDMESLGGFIEPNVLHRGRPGAGLHGRLHFGIDDFERTLYGGDDTAPMSDFGRSPGNVFFWTVHGWIDDLYAECQRAAGQEPDRTPLEMEHVHIECRGRYVPLF
jgi:hypothetical protein